ncbi:DMT family transporter [uncultured Paracoccus sp.]|uniref:DMT family transporter n=1 Tax=uncultured Paracoccus sp. TaxID=189685 RepID=UPI002606B312|nr:DMT family transporter [uncultured Paracoccus sp.]
MHTPAPLAVLGLVALATTAIVCGDTAGKLLTEAGVRPLFVAWSRFVLAALLLAWSLGLRRSNLRDLLDWRLILRAALIVGGIGSIMTALRTEPIANVFGAFFIGPVVAYALSALLLRERVSWARTAMLALGFGGVLLVVRPGGEMGTGMLFALMAGGFYGSYLTATRWLAPFHPPAFLLASQLVIGAILLLPAGLAGIPASADLRIWALLIVSSLASAFGNYLLVVVNRTTPATVSAPLIYFQLIVATLIGFLVFGDWPEPLALLGLAVIFASGLGGLVLVPRRKMP